MHSEKRGSLAVMAAELRPFMEDIVRDSDSLRESGLSDEQGLLVRHLRESVGALLFRVETMVDLVSFEESPPELHPIEFDLRGRMQIISAVISKTAEMSGNEFVMYIDDAVPDRLRGDAQRLLQAIMLFIESALFNTDHGGVLLVVEVVERADRRVVLGISAADSSTALGASEQVIFTRFSECQEFMTRKYGNSGIGIAVAYQIVTAMNGTFRVRHEKGKGIQFYVTVELQEAEQGVQPLARRVAKSIGLHSLRVLVVDDVFVNRFLLEKLLTRQGHSVTLAADAYEAVRYFDRNEYDIVLMDLQLPGMDGYQATSTMRAIEAHRGRRTPILAVSAQDFDNERARFAASGFDGFIAKPIDSEKLFGRMAELL